AELAALGVERVDARHDVRIEVPEEPRIRRAEGGVAGSVAGPARRAVAAREALAEEVLVHVDYDEEAGVARPPHPRRDLVEEAIVVGALLGLDRRPRDEEAQDGEAVLVAQ